MDNKWQDEVRVVLKPLLMCSVEQRYQLFLLTKFGKANISNIDMQGSIGNVTDSIVGILMRMGRVDEFLKEFRALPKPEWYKE